MTTNTQIAIIGAGLGGLGAAIQLQQHGFKDFLIYDRNAGVGGVWFENRYPGCCCDVPIDLYQYSFAPSGKWDYLFPRSAEVRTYAEDLVANFKLGDRLRLNSGIVKAEWNDSVKKWHLETDNGEHIVAQILISALGQLNRPYWAPIDNIGEFAGSSMHSARWDDSIALENQRVGVIGSAASAVQLIPEVATKASHLTVFQRSPNWLLPRNDMQFLDEQKLLFASDLERAAGIQQLNRQMLYENADYFFWQAFSYTEAGQAAYTKMALQHLENQITDQTLRHKLTPNYPVGCKRILFCDDYYPTLMQSHVELVDQPIQTGSATGLTTADGQTYPLDVIIHATGFEASQWLWSMQVAGQQGITLQERWKNKPEAYLGMTVSGFPNLFMLYGPNTNLGHNSILIMLEAQISYICKALESLKKQDAEALSLKPEVESEFNRNMAQDLKQTIWASPACNSWYKNADGHITQNWSSHTRKYQEACAQLELEHYEWS